MPKYIAKMPLPPTWDEVIQEINGAGAIINEGSAIRDGRFEIEFEADDLYDLAFDVQELQDSLNSILGYMSVNITKPVPVED